MSHPQQLEFVARLKALFPLAFRDRAVLEIGSLDINGTTRTFFDGGSYTGLDVAEGPGVDVVCQGQDYDAPDASFDTVISCEVMEHNPYWKETMQNMIRLCRPGGLVIMTCASTGRPEHGTTRTSPADSPLSIGIGWEYYRNLTARDFIEAIDMGGQLSVFGFMVNRESHDLYFAGFKQGTIPPGAQAALRRLQRRYWFANACARLNLGALKRGILIALVGKERYLAGPVRPWRRRPDKP
jgi:SAM-dependent methyltransferase